MWCNLWCYFISWPVSVFDVGFSSLSVVQPHFTPPMIPTLSPVPGSHAPPNHQTTPFHDGHQTHTKRPGRSNQDPPPQIKCIGDYICKHPHPPTYFRSPRIIKCQFKQNVHSNISLIIWLINKTTAIWNFWLRNIVSLYTCNGCGSCSYYFL